MKFFGRFSLVLGLFCLLAYQSLSAQTSIGFRIGISANNVDRNPLEPNEPTPEVRPGVQLGIPVEIRLNNWFAIQPELLFTTHGAFQDKTTKDLLTETRFYRTFQLNALELPVLAKFSAGTEKFKLSAFIGPSIGLGLGGKLYTRVTGVIKDPFGNILLSQTLEASQKVVFRGNNYDQAKLSDDEFAVEPVNLNLHLGLGLQFQTGRANLFLDGRLMAGLSDLDPESSAETTNATLHSIRAGLNVGVLVPIR